jgi:hypothetical protein
MNRTPVAWARSDIPRNIEIEKMPMIPRVVAALRDCGKRNAGTPLEMASTPVSAVVPAENARSIKKGVRVAAGSR